MELGYFLTLIAVAEDCPVQKSEVPAPHRGQPTIASLQYKMLAARPLQHTQEDVLFETWLMRQEFGLRPPAAELARLRAELFANPQPDLRSSPLPQQHGWGLWFDAAGKLKLCAVESAEYARIIAGEEKGIRVIKALRSRRA